MADEPLTLPRVIDRLEAAPSPLRLFYAAGADGKFHLLVDDDDMKGRLDTFRQSNRALNSRKVELEAKIASLETRLKDFDGIDAGAARAALERLAPLEATAAASAAHEKRLIELQSELEREQQSRKDAQLRSAVVAAFGERGGELRAADYVVQLAGEVFTVDSSGRLSTRARDADGALLTLETWLRATQASHPFVFKPSRGGGAGTLASAVQGSSRPQIDGSDPIEFGRHLERIATGTVVVR